jgi:hypothetical protein
MLIPIKGGIDNAKEYIYESGDIMITEWANA